MAASPVPIVAGGRHVPRDAKIRRHPAGLLEAGTAPLRTILEKAHERGLCRILLEAGPTLTSAMIREGLVDEFRVYLAPALLGGQGVAIRGLGIHGIDEAIRLDLVEVRRLGPDLALTLRPGGH